MNTNGATTTATWLNPNGAMSAVHTTINGRFFGGDTVNQQIVSGANINAPTPEPASIALMLSGFVALRMRRNGR